MVPAKFENGECKRQQFCQARACFSRRAVFYYSEFSCSRSATIFSLCASFLPALFLTCKTQKDSFLGKKWYINSVRIFPKYRHSRATCKIRNPWNRDEGMKKKLKKKGRKTQPSKFVGRKYNLLASQFFCRAPAGAGIL